MSQKKLGTKQSKETILKRSMSLKGRKLSNETKEKIRKSKLGEKNGMFGKIESEEHKKQRIKNLLLTPKWNKGLNKEIDERILRMSEKKMGKLPANAKKCRLVNKLTNEIWVEASIKRLSKLTPIHLSTINRLIKNTAGKEITKLYKFEYI